jgi:hypothetical protein
MIQCMGFDDLVNQKVSAQQGAAETRDQLATQLGSARAQFDAAIGEIGASAVRALTLRGVRPTPTGRVEKGRLSNRLVETGGAWVFDDRLHLNLLPDGGWYLLSTVTAGLSEYPTTWERMAAKGKLGTILSEAPYARLTGQVFDFLDPTTHIASGSLYTGYPDDSIHVWMIGGVPYIHDHGWPKEAVPFEEWAAAGVATLINAS